MKCKEIITYLDDWAPPGVAWDRDNVGLQVGSPEAEIQKILLCLEITPETLDEALKRKCNLIITHHPFLFQGLKKVNLAADKTAQLLATIIKNDISVLSYHTNLDFTKDGVSFQLAKALKLQSVELLTPFEAKLSKIIVFVPLDAVENVAAAMFNAGGGRIGEYTECSYRSVGEGTFLASENANPAVGSKGARQQVVETRLEVLVDNWKISGVVAAIRRAHPYEEPAIDICPVNNSQNFYGAGTIGTLKTALPSTKFLSFVKKALKAKHIRFTKGATNLISKVAVCGGSASEMLPAAIARGADAFITADIKYHTFQDAWNRIWLIDAGHYETEVVVLPEVKARLITKFPEILNNIYITDHSTNPVEFY